jgi:Flp pilus assembly protein TadB
VSYLGLRALGALCFLLGLWLVAGTVIGLAVTVAKVVVLLAGAVFAIHFVGGARRSLRESREARRLPSHDPPA